MLAVSLGPVPASLAVAGLVVLALSAWGARYNELHPVEMRVFRVANRLPDWIYEPLWLPMQLGNLVVGSAAGLVVALLLRDWPVALAVLIATGLKLVVERVIRSRMTAFADVRQRPGTSEPGAILRGDVPDRGASFPSGHVILAAAIAAVLSSALGPGWVWLPWLLTFLVMLGRVYVGAHNPLDVTAGLGAGMLIGGVLEILLR